MDGGRRPLYGHRDAGANGASFLRRYLREADLEDLGVVDETEKRILRRCYGRLRALVEVLAGVEDEPTPVGCSSSIVGIGAGKRGAAKAAPLPRDDCVVS